MRSRPLKQFTLQIRNTPEYRTMGGAGIIRGDGKFLENNKRGVEIKGGWKNVWDRRQKTMIDEVDISSRHIFNSLF